MGVPQKDKLDDNWGQNSVTTHKQEELENLAEQNLVRKFPNLKPSKRLIRLERNSILMKRLNE